MGRIREDDLERYPFMPGDGLNRSYIRTTSSLGAFVATLIGALLLFAAISGMGSFEAMSVSIRLVIVILYCTFLVSEWLEAPAILITASDIVVEDVGIRLLVMRFWQTSIPWSSLRHATIRRVTIRPLLRRSLRTDHLFAVHTPGLPTVHSLVGLFYGLGLTRVFVITPHHANYESLLERLRETAGISQSNIEI